MRQLADKTILITGSYTELGQALLDALVDYHPFCIVSIDSRGETWRGDSSNTPWYDNYYISLGDLDALISVFRLRRPAIVVHLAQDYSDNPIAAFDHNCRGTFNLLMAAEAVKETIEAVLLCDTGEHEASYSGMVAGSISASYELAYGFYVQYKLPIIGLGGTSKKCTVENILTVLEHGQTGKEYIVRGNTVMPIYRNAVWDDQSVLPRCAIKTEERVQA